MTCTMCGAATYQKQGRFNSYTYCSGCRYPESNCQCKVLEAYKI